MFACYIPGVSHSQAADPAARLDSSSSRSWQVSKQKPEGRMEL